MKKFKWNLPLFMKAFWLTAFAFLLVGLGTIGSFQSTGGSFELVDGASVVFTLTAREPKEGEKNPQDTLKNIYINVGTPYSEIGKTTKLKMRKTSSSDTSSDPYWSDTRLGTVELANLYYELGDMSEDGDKKDDKKSDVISDCTFNWIAPYNVVGNESPWNISTYKYEISVTGGNLLINEVVFVGNDDRVIPAKINTGLSSLDRESLKRAEKLLDSQAVPSLSQSSYFRYGREEAYSLMTIAEMRQGSRYTNKDIYHADAVYNAFGMDLLALGALIFGMSPFGLRVFPMLASFGILVFGGLCVLLLTKSDKAAFFFSVIYALAGIPLALGHLGTPLTIGVFFFTAALWFLLKFYTKGIRKATRLSGVPLLVAGLFAGASIAVHGAFTVPCVALVGLFAAGMVRQQVAKKYYLKKAEYAPAAELAASAEGEAPAPAPAPVLLSGEEREIAQEKVRREYRYKNALAPAFFFLGLIVGAFVLHLIGIIPIYYTYVKVYDNPANPSLGLLSLMWKGYAGGFVGSNAFAASSSPWSLAAVLYKGGGTLYAVTAAIVNPLALVLGAAGVGYAVARIVSFILAVKKGAGEALAGEMRTYTVFLALLVVFLITAAFAKSAQGFVFAAHVAAYLTAGCAVKSLAEKFGKKWEKTQLIVCGVLLAVAFLLILCFLVSIPLPNALTKLFG